MTTKRLFQLFAVSTFLFAVAFAQDEGGNCVMKDTGLAGICKLSTNCPKSEEEAKRGIRPTICSFNGLTPIVCCNDFSTIQANDNSFLPDNSQEAIVYPDDNENDNRPFTRFGKSEEKCKEYSKSITGVVQAIPLVTNTEPISISVPKCDYNGVALIVGGEPAGAGEFPFMAAVGFYVDNTIVWRCGATLISERHVLTAAHCTFSRDSDAPKLIRLGDLDLTSDDDGSIHADYEVERTIAHPDYRYPQKYNDIAIISLTENVRFSKFIRPACLHTKNQIEQNKAVATGWGKTEFASYNSDKLMKVSLNIYDNNQCARTYPPNKNIPKGITSSMICAGELKGGKDTCQGDSGGPLIVTKKENQCKFYVIGITSFGKSCGQANTPAVYTKVSQYVPWIEQTIW